VGQNSFEGARHLAEDLDHAGVHAGFVTIYKNIIKNLTCHRSKVVEYGFDPILPVFVNCSAV